MAKAKLWEYAVLYHPKPQRDAGGHITKEEKSALVIGPKVELAVTDKEVGMLAAKAIPDDYNDKLDDVEIIIRPF